jgi:phosphoribosylaminoimidazole (AIR) synthetase
MRPTKIYVKSCLAAIKTGGVHALANITGGGIPVCPLKFKNRMKKHNYKLL